MILVKENNKHSLLHLRAAATALVTGCLQADLASRTSSVLSQVAEMGGCRIIFSPKDREHKLIRS